MAAKAGTAKRPQQVSQRLEAEKIQALIGNLKLDLRLGISGLSGGVGLQRGVRRLIDGDEIFLLHAVDQALDQLVQLTLHLQLLDALAQVVTHEIARLQRLLDGLAQRLEIVFIQLLEINVLAVEAGFQHVVGERVEEVLQTHFVCEIADVFGELRVFHCATSRTRNAGEGALSPTTLITFAYAATLTSEFLCATGLGVCSNLPS